MITKNCLYLSSVIWHNWTKNIPNMGRHRCALLVRDSFKSSATGASLLQLALQRQVNVALFANKCLGEQFVSSLYA